MAAKVPPAAKKKHRKYSRGKRRKWHRRVCTVILPACSLALKVHSLHTPQCSLSLQWSTKTRWNSYTITFMSQYAHRAMCYGHHCSITTPYTTPNAIINTKRTVIPKTLASSGVYSWTLDLIVYSSISETRQLSVKVCLWITLLRSMISVSRLSVKTENAMPNTMNNTWRSQSERVKWFAFKSPLQLLWYRLKAPERHNRLCSLWP